MEQAQNNTTQNASYADQALKTLQGLFRGNGVRAENLRLSACDAQTITLEAITEIDLRPRIEQTRVTGKIGGTVVHTQTLMQETLTAQIKTLADQPGLRTELVKIILARPDKGFLLPADYVVPLPTYRTNVILHEGCLRCRHTGGTICTTCQGARDVTCSRCQGTRSIPCQNCNGTREIYTAQGPQPCQVCRHTGRQACGMCHERGRVPCQACKAQGSLRCEPCGGTGWTSLILTGILEAHTAFTLDDTKAPADIVERVRALGANAARSDDWTITPDPQAFIDAKEKLALPYRLQSAYAAFTLVLGRTNMQGTVFGPKAKILTAPPFLQSVLRKPLKKILDAARNKTGITDALHSIGKYRLLREALILSTKVGPGKAVVKLRQIYPAGITPQALSAIVRAQDDLVQLGTQKSRRLGVAVGVALSTLLFFGQKMLGLSALAGVRAGDTGLQVMWFALVSSLLLALLYIVIRFAARQEMARLLKGVLPEAQIKGLYPRAGNLFYGGATYCLVAFAAIAFFAP